jgi:PAS domain S-box-containing protein
MLIDHLPAYISYIDTDHRYRLVNRRYEEWFGVSHDHLEGRLVKEVQGEAAYARIQPHLDEALAGTPVHYEHQLVDASEVTHYLDNRYLPHRSDSGEILGCFVLVTDISDRKRAEEALRLSEERYRALYDNNPSMYFMVTPEGQVLSVNQFGAHHLGYTQQDLIGRSVLEVIHPEDHPAVHHHLASCLLDLGAVKTWEFRKVRRDGSVLWVREVARGLYNNAQQPVILIVCEDMTERKLLETRLLQTHKMEAIGTLAGGIAHDFNNILTSILGFTSLALKSVPDHSTTQRHLGYIQASGNRAKALVSQILTFSRQHENRRAPLHLGEIVQESLELLRASLPATVEIHTLLDPSCGMISADPTQMHQVLVNLYGNAEHSMRGVEGYLDISLHPIEVTEPLVRSVPNLQVGPYVHLTVRDSGRGMSPTVLERIFDPFFTTKPVGEGTGLGLSVVHGIVTAHDGAISVHSSPGLGTTISLYFPRVSTPIGRRATASLQALRQPGTEHILIVDDEEDILFLAQQELETQGYQVTVKSHALAALEIFTSAPDSFDLVVTDQTMPKMTGGALAAELLRIRPDLPIILCTGFSHTMSAEQAQAMGLRAFLMKPFTVLELADTIRRVLDRPAD